MDEPNHPMADHFYTLRSDGEGCCPPYGPEGIVGYVFPPMIESGDPRNRPSSPGHPGTVPFRRYWNGRVEDHLYTARSDETTAYLASAGYAFEGPEANVFFEAQPANGEYPATVPLHRWFCPNTGDHFYCTDPAGELAPSVGYVYEFIACHIFPSPAVGAVPLYRWFYGGHANDWCITLTTQDGTVRFRKSVTAGSEAQARSLAVEILIWYNIQQPNFPASIVRVTPGKC